MKYRGLVIADIHIGAVKPIERAYDEIKKCFFKYIETNGEDLDFIIVCGDFFNNKRYLNDDVSKMAYKILYELLSLCKKFSLKIRFLYGTESHECNQYDILETFKDEFENFEVIRHVKEEKLFEDLHILYIPEEHILDQEEYYKDYFDDNHTGYYDYIFGHGIIKEVMREASANIETKKSTRKHVPVFKTAQLDRVTIGDVYFGHYHVHTNIEDKIFYVGSYSRWMFGEEETKGFYDISCNPEKDKYERHFVENNMCETYKTLHYGYSNKIFTDINLMEKEFNRIDKILSDGIIEHIRLSLNIPETADNPEFIINYLKERYRFVPNVKLDIVNGYVEKKKQTSRTEIDKLLTQYDMILDKKVAIEDKISYFINMTYEKNKEMDSKKIKHYLDANLSDLLN